MKAEACPYCRTAVTVDDATLACEGCGTRHHTDCYAENGGCTIFGCSKAPGDEPKLRVSTPELAAVPAPTIVAERRLPPPPPPPPGVASANADEVRRLGHQVVPSIFGGFGETSTATTAEETQPTLEPKSRTTYIFLGALLGAFGAHSFYAGYRNKGGIQLAITVLTLGFGSPMSWMWAVIDICTIHQDSSGVQFES